MGEEFKFKFGFIPVTSSLNNLSAETLMLDFLSGLHEIGGELVDPDKIVLSAPIFFFVLTGGTEKKVLKLWAERKNYISNEPIIIIAHPGNNSLPASLEILARIQQDGGKGKIIYLDNETNKNWQNNLENTVDHFHIFHQLKKTKVGLIGSPSEWLVASTLEISKVKNIWGPSVIKIELEELKNKINAVKEEQIEEAHYYFTNNAVETKEPSKKEIKQVVRVYAALKELITHYELTSISVRCFDLVTDLKTTGCFALSKLNDDGIIAGCEGDLVSTLGMLWANYLTEQTVWMANPAQLDESNNSMWLAHCTVPLSMTENYKLRSHFESGLGVGIQGELSKGKVTVLRIGGKNLEKIWVSNGEILETGNAENLCRTQVKVKLHGSAKVSDFLTAPLGNHILLMRGSFAKELTEWWEMFIAKELSEN
jgi:L-fucose isomerase-like protein